MCLTRLISLVEILHNRDVNGLHQIGRYCINFENILHDLILDGLFNDKKKIDLILDGGRL